jgi:hypothetical protein
MGQGSLFSRAEIAVMCDRTASRNYSAARDEFRRDHERHRSWGLQRRHAEKLRRIRQSGSGSASAGPPPAPTPQPITPAPQAAVAPLSVNEPWTSAAGQPTNAPETTNTASPATSTRQTAVGPQVTSTGLEVSSARQTVTAPQVTSTDPQATGTRQTVTAPQVTSADSRTAGGQQAAIAPRATCARQAAIAPQVVAAPSASAARQAGTVPRVAVAPSVSALRQAGTVPQVAVAPSVSALRQAGTVPPASASPPEEKSPPVAEVALSTMPLLRRPASSLVASRRPGAARTFVAASPPSDFPPGTGMVCRSAMSTCSIRQQRFMEMPLLQPGPCGIFLIIGNRHKVVVKVSLSDSWSSCDRSKRSSVAEVKVRIGEERSRRARRVARAPSQDPRAPSQDLRCLKRSLRSPSRGLGWQRQNLRSPPPSRG